MCPQTQKKKYVCIKISTMRCPEPWRAATDKNMHVKKKWKVSRNAKFVMRQDVPSMNWALLPSPELQLEHEVRCLLLGKLLLSRRCSLVDGRSTNVPVCWEPQPENGPNESGCRACHLPGPLL
jgi:hypothetical protein